MSKRIVRKHKIQDEQALKYIQNVRRARSYPEELLRGPCKLIAIQNGQKDEEVCSARAYAHNNRMKSSGELQSALVTLAIKNGDSIQLWRLLTRKDVDVNHMDGFGMQPVHYASLYGELEILKILLQFNIDINVTTKSGEYALDLAVKEGNFEVAQYLVNNGARVKNIVNGIKDTTRRSCVRSRSTGNIKISFEW